jgi:threonine aldolase
MDATNDPTGPAAGPTAAETAGGTPAETAADPADDRHPRRRRAVEAATKVLADGPRRTLAEALRRLSEGAADVYDLGERVDAYGDGVVAELERRTADLLGKPAAVFFPTGTMAQQVALRVHAARAGVDTVALHPLAHPEVHEDRALGALTGLRTVHPTTEWRQPTPDEVLGLGEPIAALMLELPLRDAGFTLPSWTELTALCSLPNVPAVHLDGARLWECVDHFGRPLHEIAALADSVYVSYYKSLGGISGAALAADEEFADEARLWRHRYGGALYQQWPAALTALTGLATELPRLPEYVSRAREVAAVLGATLSAELPWARINPAVPHTHQFQVWVGAPWARAELAAVTQAEQTGVALFPTPWTEPALPGLSMTEVTISGRALEWSLPEVESAARDFAARLQARA